MKPSDSYWEATSADLTKHDGHIEIKWELESNKDRKKSLVFLPSPTVSSHNFLTKGKGTTTKQNKIKQNENHNKPNPKTRTRRNREFQLEVSSGLREEGREDGWDAALLTFPACYPDLPWCLGVLTILLPSFPGSWSSSVQRREPCCVDTMLSVMWERADQSHTHTSTVRYS